MEAVLENAGRLSHSARQLDELVLAQRRFFAEGTSLRPEYRRAQLQALRQAILSHEKQIEDALYADFGKSRYEVYGSEIAIVLAEIKHNLRNLGRWMKPKYKRTPLYLLPSTSYIEPLPRGNVLIIGPWNYPFNLVMVPLVNAIAAGNTAIIKPSELAIHTAAIVQKIVESIFTPEFIAIVQGPGELISHALIKKYHFNLVFFTGSSAVGAKVMEAAASHLSPVVLELGGKSPTIVTTQANIPFAAKRIMWGKLFNAGQTCVAPDYILVHESVRQKLIDALIEEIKKTVGEDAEKAPDYPRIINNRHFQRIKGLMVGSKIIYGGQSNAETRFFGPALIHIQNLDEAAMQEEIFGPILPIISYKNNEEALQVVEKHPYPLALYIFSQSRREQLFFRQNIRSGTCAINNVLIQFASPFLPVKGVGPSGMGGYKSKFGFEQFSHFRPTTHSPTWIDMPLWYQPYGDKIKWLKKLL